MLVNQKLFACLLLNLIFFSGFSCHDIQRDIFEDALDVWNLYRDPENGFYCDTLRLSSDPNASIVPCGSQNNFYSSAGTGMGLISEAIVSEMGYHSYEVSRKHVYQTLNEVMRLWPKEPFSGFLVHFTNRNYDPLSEYSTIDTAELVLGALFAGNYFGGEILQLAMQLRDSVHWSDAIKAADNPRIYPVVNPDTGEFSGNIRPYNEYYLVAYLAMLTSPDDQSKASQYFATYMGFEEPPGDGSYPVHKNYWGFDLLTDNPNIFMSSFIPQFCYYLSRGFQMSHYYNATLFPDWLEADIKYWSLALNENSEIWGVPVYGKVFGAGAGPGPSGYSVERIDGSPDLVISAAIMAGFLPAATKELKEVINAQLEWMYTFDVCAYAVKLPDPSGRTAKILWRCSVRLSDWRAPSVDSIDFSTMILGYASNFLPSGFYVKYAS